ncbi:AFR338Wp [Eremothecium gossypii ATCC 10895]|uniref:Mitochondrial zinc maintenance protein 1, mitochondrial n=1 Tax=Eremothecium gossypii (strain ATCC 10895 / CBS 109.51 / FGSC 9923 / NRRL Y-1056) TaxID=284811 RepID=MZM1_EREGS|nr:AFR338Wp [Eremothecium gossypii ATCC 10895]Q753H4.1 RecName: Full=Mitochondrial zinc maintenance protein 1, mitochondrial; Flags: Precursor [Eremothecium gossypii ATCC 10895]AAS53709.1 AFR338Wp [Eremothecium gossypii ATCC 10895]
MSTSSRALAAYRNALRATKVAFGEDVRMLVAARKAMRHGMLAPDASLPVEDQITHMNDIATFLRRNLVQGKKVSGKDDVYQLRIHEETELGDNATIKETKTTLASQGGGCCGGGKDLYK